MRKIIYCLMLAVSFVLASCSGCTEHSEKIIENSNDSTVIESLVVEDVISTSRESMFLNYGNYTWFETCILMKDYMDSETDGSVEEVTSIFQVVTEETETGADVHVIIITQTLDTNMIEVKHDFWIEDCPLNNDTIKLTFEDAFLKLMESNYPKPHSKNCVLRREVGPRDANPQYIFGNTETQIYVDAVTGEVSEYDPAFPNE